MRLLKVRLEGVYKGLQDQEFDFSAAATDGGVVAVIGLNGAGKSQIFELIAEIFSFLERAQRADFGKRKSLGFGFEVIYQYEVAEESVTYRTIGNKAGKVTIAKWGEGQWSDISFLEAKLPQNVIGYSSGLNENIQRAFLKNAVAYYDVMSIRSRRRKFLARSERESDYPIIEERVNARYLKRYPGIFGGAGEEFSERDTPSPNVIFLDYDCNNLLLFAMALLTDEERDSTLHHISFRHPVKAEVHFDVTGVPYGEDALEDILQLIRASGGRYTPRALGRELEADLDDLNYKAGCIHIDLTSPKVADAFKREYRGDPYLLFSKLYKIYLLGVKFWSRQMQVALRKDAFFGAVKKPVKAKSPLEIRNLRLSDSAAEIDADDLSDGEWQLIQILSAARTFGGQSLFILDEPEAHFNPVWRTQFHKDLTHVSDVVRLSDDFYLISTHSPFLVSSLRESNVFYVARKGGKTSIENVSAPTFGAPFDVIIKSFFGMQSLISQTAIDEVVDHLNKNDATNEQKAEWISRNMSDSIEKAYLLRKLRG